MQRAAEVYLKHRAVLLALAGVGLLTLGATAVYAPQRAWANLLLAGFNFVSIALYGTVFVALNYVLSAGWGVVMRRVPEAMSACLPVGAGLMVVVFLGRSYLYPWARAGALSTAALGHKGFYLNAPFFLARMVVALGLWIFFSHLLRHHSRRQDVDGDWSHTSKSRVHSALFLLLLAGTYIFTSIDWIMSLEPEWYSTMFPVYCFTGLLLGGTASMAVLLICLWRRELVPGVSNHHLYELARLICAASTFWAYIWFSQYMLIYYTNIPEEAVYFARRLTRGWSFLFLLNPVLNWLIPLVILLSASARRSPRWLATACLFVLLGRWLDTYLLIMPALALPLRFGLTEVLIFVGSLALFVLMFLRSFRAAEPVPKHDPYLVESIHLRV